MTATIAHPDTDLFTVWLKAEPVTFTRSRVRLTDGRVLRAQTGNVWARLTELTILRDLDAMLRDVHGHPVINAATEWIVEPVDHGPLVISTQLRIPEPPALTEDMLHRLGANLRALHDVDIDALPEASRTVLRDESRIVRSYMDTNELIGEYDHLELLLAEEKLETPDLDWLLRPVLMHGDTHMGNQIDGIIIDLDTLCAGNALQDLSGLICGTLDVIDNDLPLAGEIDRTDAITALLGGYLAG